MNVDEQHDTPDPQHTETVDLEIGSDTELTETECIRAKVMPDSPDLQHIETVDLEVESDTEPTKTECITAKARPDSKPEEEIVLTTLNPVDPHSLKTSNAAHQSTSNLGLKIRKNLIPLQVKGGTVKGTIMISKEQMTTLIKKQKAGVPITLAMSKTKTLDPHNKKRQIIKPKNNDVTVSPEAQLKPLPVSKAVTTVCTMSPQCTVSPQTVNIIQNMYTVPTVQTLTSPQAMPINSLPSPLMYPNSTITPQYSANTTLNNPMSLNLGTPTGMQNASFTTVSDVMKWNPVGALALSQNASVTTLSDAVQNNVVGFSYNVVAPSVPSNIPTTHNINVLPQNPSICRPIVKTILPKTVTVPRGVTNRFVVRPTSIGTTQITGSGDDSPRNSTPNQPRLLLTKINSASNKNSVPYQLKIVPSPSGGNPTVTKVSQNGTPANMILPCNAGASKTNGSSKTVVQRPIVPGRKQTREVIMPRVQLDGSVRLEKRIVPWTGKLKNQNHFTLSEVRNNPLESGVAKKFVVAPTSGVLVSSSSLPQKTVPSTTINTAITDQSSILTLANTSKTVHSTTSSTVNTAKTVHSTTSTTFNTAHVNVGRPSIPPWLLNKRPQEIRPQSPVKDCPNSGKSVFRWHHPYTGGRASTVDAPEVAGDSIMENDPVSISDDDEAHPSAKTLPTPPLVAGVPETSSGSMCILDDHEQLDPIVPSQPPLPNTEKNSAMSIQLSSNAEEQSTKNDSFSPRIEYGSVHSVAQSDELNSKSSSVESKFQWHQPCTDAEASSPRSDSALIENATPRIRNEAPPVKFQVKAGRHWSKTLFIPTIKKKKNKKKKETAKDGKLKMKMKKNKKKNKKALKNKNVPDVKDSKADIMKDVSSSSRPASPSGDPLSVRTSSPGLRGNSFQWHHPSTDNNPVKAVEKSEVVQDSELKTESVSLPDSSEQEARGPSSPGYGQEPGITEDTSEPKYSPRSDAEASVNNEQGFPRIEIDSVHSITKSKHVAISSPFSEESQKHSSCITIDELPSISVADDKEGTLSAENPLARTASPGLEVLFGNDVTILNKMQLNVERRLKAKAEGWSTDIPTVSRPLKRVLAGGHDKLPQKLRKKILSSVPTTQSQNSEQIGNISKLSNGPTKQESSSEDKIGDSNVLRDCIVRKTIQDSYLEGVIPTIDKIHYACCDSGLELPKTAVEPYLISIGYNWVTCKSQRLLLEDHRFTAERIKYLNKLKKYQGKNLVYIFVSEFVKRNGNVWQVSPNDVKRPSLDAARVVLHAISNNHLLEDGLEMVKIGLFGLRRNDIISWLKCSVIPYIPQGSVVIFGRHPVFVKDEETEQRPNITYSKDEIVSWLTSHKVTSVNPDLPKALLLCKVNNVILPKTSIFDKLFRQTGFVPLHLPKHHMDLNPVEFVWRDILEKLYKTPEIISVDDLQDFVAREFSSCSQMLSSVACDLVRKFGCSYREFDSRSDELFEKLLSDTNPVTDAAPSVVEADVAKKSTRSGKLPLTKCPICLGTKRFKGYRCSRCKNFWYRLKHDYKFRLQTGKTLPVCEEITHIVARPPDCLGCLRHRYELALFNQVNIMKKRPRYVLPIPPVTELGKKHWSKKFKRRSKKSSSLTRRESQDDDEEN